LNTSIRSKTIAQCSPVSRSSATSARTGSSQLRPCDWLFPGRHAGQPAAYRPMAAQLREHGLPLRTARISALRQLVLQVPAPVIAGALGFHHTTTTRQHVKAAGPWSQYAGGDREP
jgi:hypothetical protein